MPAEGEGLLHLLGPPRWHSPDGKQHDVPDSLPGYLLVFLASVGDWSTREALTATFWPARAEPEALANLRANLHRVRLLLSTWNLGDALLAEPRRVRVELPTDVAALRDACARGDWIAAARFPGDSLLAAMSFRGFALVEEWASESRRGLAALWEDAALKAAQSHEQRNEPERAVELLLRLVQRGTPAENVVQALLRLAAGAGRRDEALAAFERFRDWLGTELRLQPSPATSAMAAALRSPATGPAVGQADGAAPPAAKVGLLLFGSPQIGDPQSTPFAPEKKYQLLVLLALRSGEWVAREQLAALLWPERAGADARRNLRHALFKARTIPGVEAVEATDQALRWNIATDVDAFLVAVRDRRFADALRLRRGPLAVGIDDPGDRAFAEWIAAERARIDARWQQAARDHLDTLAEPNQRIAHAQLLLQADPLDEVAFSALLAAEVELGHRDTAQRLYRDYAARLLDELGVEPPRHLRDLLAAAASTPDGVRRDKDAEFVGRRTELAELTRLLRQSDCRSITIVGPGGVGKSSLARRVLEQVRTQFPGGQAWVELEDLDNLPAVVARLARQLGFDVNDAQDPLRQISDRLQGAAALAVLDNAEHLTGLAALLDRLLDSAASLKVVLTSRTRTHGRHERALPLEGLAVPDEESRDLEAAATFDAVRLFDLRASAAQRGFQLARHREAAIEIVDAVGGLPLAIELAASWTRLLPAEEIARDLCGAIDLLERDPAAPGVPARPEHASMRAVLDRTWALLAPREREAMAALSVFQGGFTHAAARQVADVPLPVLSSLVDRSLLKADPSGRFDMHPLVAAEAGRRARGDQGRNAATRLRHAEHFARHLAASLGEPTGDPRSIVDAVNADQANCLLAWRQAIGCGRHDLVAAMHPAWRAYFSATGKYAQSVRHFDEALGIEASPQATAELRATLAYFLVRDRKPERAMALAAESLAVAESSGDSVLAQSCVATIGGCKLVLGQWPEAKRWIERSLGLARAQGARRETASELTNLALITTFLGEFDRAIGLYEEGIAIQTELGNSVNVARAMCNLGFVHVARGDWPRALQPLEQALRYALDRGITAVALEAEFLLGSTQVELGLLDAAQRHLQHARDGFRGTRNAGFELKTDYYLARIAARRGSYDEAARDLLAAVRTARGHGWTYDVLYAAIFVAELLATRQFPREAALILRSIRSAPRAHAFVGTLVDAGLRTLPVASGGGDIAETPAASFDVIADHIVSSRELDELLLRLRGPVD